MEDVVFARTGAMGWGAPLRVGSVDEGVGRVIERCGALSQRVLGLHVWPRETQDPLGKGSSTSPPEGLTLADASDIDALLRAAFGRRVVDGARLADDSDSGRLVLDVVLVDPGVWWLGLHTHAMTRWALPGGRLDVRVPAGAPSRVYAKVVEGLAWSRAPMQPGDWVVDIGAAPGGGTLALLERGLRVVALDPAEMDPGLAAFGDAFRHVALPFQAADLAALPPRVDWVVYDVNLDPRQMLQPLLRWARALRPVRGMLVTLKLNKPTSHEKLPWMLRTFQEAGFPFVRATQLPSNRREVCVWATRSSA